MPKKTKLKTIAVVTPGGDAPGMNPAIRAVVRTAIFNGLKVFGIEKGWLGLIEGKIKDLELQSVGGIINRGGTILHTHRCPEFRQKDIRKKAYEKIKAYNIEGLVVIGGDGSLNASNVLIKEFQLPIINIPASIDNDIFGTDYSIGFDTAVNTAVEAIDKIRDTATSHERVFVIEVMGRNNGFIALDVGLVCGAEAIIIPEVPFNIDAIGQKLRYGQQRGKSSFIVVVAEGAARADDVAKQLQKRTKLDVRVSILGHIQRGGSPTALSREAACKLGARAVQLLLEGKKGFMVGLISDKVIETPIDEVLKKKKSIDMNAYKLANMLAS
ncbi:MAG: 6-phosphofructokinase [Candidatus Saganbacteria bacterium]|uniref:ATP-dependent 6-phosphofructokinase n=1 Tax=Candidatus Saganbacteria bacterium TaxID=2575572 RepID=A0A833L1B8_UNCSA|nr:MAG: 6-phosphofructokinase [Candidatus Saganbacteria bacterium]